MPAVLCLAVALLLGGCTLDGARASFALAVIADGSGTNIAMTTTSGYEANPVLRVAPVPVLLLVSAVSALICEHLIDIGHVRAALWIYRLGAVVHGAAATWNIRQAYLYGALPVTQEGAWRP